MTAIFDDIRKALDELALYILTAITIPRAKHPWVSPGVLVVNSPTEFSPDKEIVQAKYDLEISWILQKIRDIFFENEIVSKSNKNQFFTTLAKSTNAFIKTSEDNYNVCDLLLVVLHHTYLLLNEIESFNTFETEYDFSEIAVLYKFFLNRLAMKIN